MTRYYVMVEGSAGLNPYIVAEVVRERSDDGSQRATSLAANLAGDDAAIVTETELSATASGRQALRRWKAGNDVGFELDDAILRATEHRRPMGPSHWSDADVTEASDAAIAVELLVRGRDLLIENRRRLDELRGTLKEMRARRATAGTGRRDRSMPVEIGPTSTTTSGVADVSSGPVTINLLQRGRGLLIENQRRLDRLRETVREAQRQNDALKGAGRQGRSPAGKPHRHLRSVS